MAEQAYIPRLKQHYNEVLKTHVEGEVLDSPAPGDAASSGESEAGQAADMFEPASTSDASADGPYATPQQIAALKRLAQQVGDEAYADVQDMLEHHPEGLVLGVYEIVRQRLRARKAAKKEDTPVDQPS